MKPDDSEATHGFTMDAPLGDELLKVEIRRVDIDGTIKLAAVPLVDGGWPMGAQKFAWSAAAIKARVTHGYNVLAGCTARRHITGEEE